MSYITKLASMDMNGQVPGPGFGLANAQGNTTGESVSYYHPLAQYTDANPWGHDRHTLAAGAMHGKLAAFAVNPQAPSPFGATGQGWPY